MSNRHAVRVVFLAAGVMCFATTAHGQAVIHVDDDAPLGGDGTTWATAYKYLQDALAVATLGDDIRVAVGSYTPDQDEAGNVTAGDRTATFHLISGVGLYGGYAGLTNPGNPDERDINIYETVLSGDLNGDDGSDFVNNDENSYHVVTGSGTDGTAILDAFSITAGNANGEAFPAYKSNGGGMYSTSGSPSLTNCTFRGNSADGAGGMYNRENSNPTLDNCTFSSNLGIDGVGGVWNMQGSSPTFSNCIFIGNVSGSSAGGMFNAFQSSPTLTDCTFIGNSAVGRGGGMRNLLDSCPTLVDCIFSGNNAGSSGGGIYNAKCSPTLINCRFSQNSASHYGGGMVNYEDAGATLINCTFDGNSARDGGGMETGWGSRSTSATNCRFIGNTADIRGGGIHAGGNSTTMTNCLFIGNTAGDFGGAIFKQRSNLTLSNCTLGSNYARNGRAVGCDYGPSNLQIVNCILRNGGDEVWNNDGSTITITYSDVQGGWPGAGGTGNLNADPLFLGGPSGTWTADATYDEVMGQTTLHDVGAALSDDELVGKFLNPDGTQVLQSVIVANTATTITVWGDCASLGVTGSAYQVNDYRLTGGSPCVEAGDNDAVPPDVADLDEDGDTTEQTPLDLDGNPRFSGVVDMGAYELENIPPVCNANGPYVAECQGTTTNVALDGSASSDPDGDTLTFLWWTTDCPGASFGDDTSETPTLTVDSIAPCPLACTVFLTVDDGNGGSDDCDATVTIEDTTDPALVGVPGDVTVECDAVPPPAGVTTTDKCDADPTIDFDEVRTDGACEDTYMLTRTWTATDSCGNWTQATQIVTVQDTTDPVLIGAPGDVTVECDSVPSPAVVTATDNCDPNPTVDFDEVRTDGDCEGNYTLTRRWTATDHCGNSAEAIQTITVQDTTSPVIGSCPADIMVDCAPNPGQVVTFDVPTASDNCDLDPTIACDPPSGSVFPIGTTEVTCTAEDNCDNIDSCSFDVTLTVCGACCNFDGSCEDFVLEDDCLAAPSRAWNKDTLCEEAVCEEIPTVSEWGLIMMTLLGCTIGTLVYRGHPVATE